MMMNIKAHGSEKNDDIDRISSLPDEILMHILSFLSTRNTVQTCILSKRWINTWASVPDLKFNIKEFGLPEIIDGEMVVQFVTKFELLVKSVLEKRETSYVNIFRLRLDSCIYWPRTQGVANCIGDVMKLEPRKCLVKLSLCKNLTLNTNLIFTCASLVYLQLCFSTKNDDLVAIEPNVVNLPCLKILNLDGFTMSNDSLNKLLLGCSVLEELVLESCYLGGIIKICSDTLKKLVLRKCYEVKRLHISTPNLMYLDVIVDTMDMLLNMPLLVDASIYLDGWYDQNKYVTMGPKLIHNLSNVESLILKYDYPKRKVQKKDFSNFPVFNNLKSLKLVSWCFYVFDLAPYFLHHSPKLQELTLTNRSAYHVIQYADKETIQEGPRDELVQREFLKTVRIAAFKKYNGFVDKLINKLLVHVKVIGEIDIVQRVNW